MLAADVSPQRKTHELAAVAAAIRSRTVLGAAKHQSRLNLAYAASGGTLNGDGLAEWLAAVPPNEPGTSPGPAISQVARWIVKRNVVAFDGPAGWLLPRFQFDATLRSVRPEVAALLAELTRVFDADATAVWLITPNAALDGVQPVVALDSDPPAVLLAARAARERNCRC